ncbi:MAG: hypothetical protein BM485_11695 [Desulfobulbaceae bacterium DB1]|nr:MAG: hypothetical protein BM485_11695 [Desulfobulbaceae bacterium DB1]
MRQLSDKFLNDLKIGLLSPMLKRIKDDNTLMLAIRENYVNIYYRGGNIMKIEATNTDNTYKAFFDTQYNKTARSLPDMPPVLSTATDVTSWIAALPNLKETMDFFLSVHNKPEREFQQLVARENNFSPISNETEYFLSDIEFADSDIGARFDMLAIRWQASARKDGSNCRPALIEMKYGDNALSGKAGIIEHLDDFKKFIENKEKYGFLLDTMSNQFSQLDELDLLNFNRSKGITEVIFGKNTTPEIIFLLANHNPRSTKLRKIINDPKLDKYGQSALFDLRFFVASFAGYGFHSKCMLSLKEFRSLLNT